MKDYQKKAQNTYNSRFDMTTLRLPRGTKDRIRQSMGNDVNISQFCINSILSELEILENKQDNPSVVVPVSDSSIDPGFYQTVDFDKYQDMKTLVPKPQPMSAEDEGKVLQELQRKIDARNMPRINEIPSESILEDTDKEMDATGDKAAQNGNMESVGDILENFMNPPETDFLTQKEQEINERLKQKASDDKKFKPLTEEKIDASIQKHGMDLLNDSELIEQIVKAHGKTNYERIIATMKHKRIIRTEDDFKVKGE